MLPEPAGRWHGDARRRRRQALLKMEFKRFVNALMHLPCQIVRTGRRIVYRLLAWNPWQSVPAGGGGAAAAAAMLAVTRCRGTDAPIR